MPSILVKSEPFADEGIALTSHQIREQSSGLVNVAISYAIDPPRRRDFDFSLDAAPPIFPQSFDSTRLKERALFLIDHDSRFENGLIYIDARYAGALDVPVKNIFRSVQYETLSLLVGADLISYRRAVITLEAAGLTEEGVSNALGDTPNPFDLIVGAYYLVAPPPPAIFGVFGVPVNNALTQLRTATAITVTEEEAQIITPSLRVRKVIFFPQLTYTPPTSTTGVQV